MSIGKLYATQPKRYHDLVFEPLHDPVATFDGSHLGISDFCEYTPVHSDDQDNTPSVTKLVVEYSQANILPDMGYPC